MNIAGVAQRQSDRPRPRGGSTRLNQPGARARGLISSQVRSGDNAGSTPATGATGVAQSGRASALVLLDDGSTRRVAGSNPAPGTGPHELSSPDAVRRRFPNQVSTVASRRVAGTGRRERGRTAHLASSLAGSRGTQVGSHRSVRPERVPGSIPGSRSIWASLYCLVCEQRNGDHCRHCQGCP